LLEGRSADILAESTPGEEWPDLEYRWMGAGELPRLADINRQESVQTGYALQNGQLTPMQVDWQIPSFSPEGQGGHSLAAQIAFCQRHVEDRAILLGAFVGGKLVALAVLTPEVRHSIAQLAYLQVSREYRRQGIASHLLQELVKAARQEGTRQLYVSATPSESAVGFYLQHGFVLASEPLPELLAAEPEDIHMIKDL